MTTFPSRPQDPTDDTGVTVANCDREPIHIPGSVQPHGVLVAVDPGNHTVLQVSENVGEFLGVPPEKTLGRDLATLLGGPQAARFRQAAGREDLAADNPLALTVEVNGHERLFHGVLHGSGGTVVLELEPAPDPSEAGSGSFGFYRLLREAMTRLQGAESVQRLCEIAVEEVRRLTGFDRVMLSRFDAAWNGQVLAEARRATVDSHQGLHFPASDFPSQARELYRRNWLRFVVDAAARPSKLTPQNSPLTGQPLDLSFSVLRSVSPIHLEYLRNMGVMASLSVSILKDGALWGLIACHHTAPRLVPYETRLACEFLGQILSGQLAVREEAERHAAAAHLREVRERLVDRVGESDDLPTALLSCQDDLLELTDAAGAAVSVRGQVHRIGSCPDEAQTRRLVEWVMHHKTAEAYATDDLPSQFPEAASYPDRASGVLGVSLSRSHGDGILWFRPEVVRTVNWAGNPNKPVTPGEAALHPRTSFALWQETVRGKARPWSPAEQEAARELRNALTALALRGSARQLAHVNGELARRNQELDAFAYIASHDLKAPLRGISQLTDWIEEDLGPALTEESRGYLSRLRGRVTRMQGLIGEILDYARAGRTAIRPETVDVGVLLNEVVDLLSPRDGLQVEIAAGMPVLVTERIALQQVFLNLIGNGIKYNTKPHGRVTVLVRMIGPVAEFAVTDDGPGIEPDYHEKIFGIFQTLQARDTFESTGIGLALVKKIVESRGGRVTVESALGHGATFRFTWPPVD